MRGVTSDLIFKIKRLTALVLVCSFFVGTLSTSLQPSIAFADPLYPELISVGDQGQFSNGFGRAVDMSDDGRTVIFGASATNLTANQNNPNVGNGSGSCSSIFVRDRLLGQTKLITVNSQGEEQNGCATGFGISGDGRYAFFTEWGATNLGLDPIYVHPGYGDAYLFRHDLLTSETLLVSVDGAGNPRVANESGSLLSFSFNGNRITYDGILRDIASQTIYEIAGGYITSVSNSGQAVAYSRPTNGYLNENAIFLRDLTDNSDTFVYEAPANDLVRGFLTGDGMHVLFSSYRMNIPGAPILCQYTGCFYIFDAYTNSTRIISATVDGEVAYPNVISTDDVSDDGTKMIVSQANISSDNVYTQVSFEPTGVIFIDLENEQSYPVGYALAGQNPEQPVASQEDHHALRADGEELVFISNANNFGVPPNCIVNTEGTITLEQCGEVFVAATAPPNTTQAITLSASADTYLRSGQSNRNHGGDIEMRIQSSGDNRGLVRFEQGELESAANSHEVTSATLRLTITDNGNNWGSEGRTIDLHRLLMDWVEGNGKANDRGEGEGATWNCAFDSIIENQARNCSGTSEWEMGQPNNPSVHPWFETPTATQTITNGQSGVVEFDVTADIIAFLSGESDNYGWLVKKTNEGQNGMVSFGTRESSFVPELVITYQP